MGGGGGNGPARLEGEGAELEGADVHGVLDELRLVLFERHLAENWTRVMANRLRLKALESGSTSA